jgi:hypothetical protein
MTPDQKLSQLLDDVSASRVAPALLKNLERLPFSAVGEVANHWTQPGNVGNDSGGSGLRHGNSIWTLGATALNVQARPIMLPGGQSDDFFYLLPLVKPSKNPDRLIVGFDDFSLLTEKDASACQAREFQIEDITAGRTFNGAWQIRRDGTFWYYTWRANAKGNWNPAHLPAVDVTKPLQLQAEFTLDRAAGTMNHRELCVNGVRHSLNIVQPAEMQNASTNKLTASFQLDGNKNGDAYTANVCGMSVAWL